MKRLLVAACAALWIFPALGETDPQCAARIGLLQNILAIQKQRVHDRCALLERAVADREAMLDTLAHSRDNCGLPAATVARLRALRDRTINERAIFCR